MLLLTYTFGVSRAGQGYVGSTRPCSVNINLSLEIILQTVACILMRSVLRRAVPIDPEGLVLNLSLVIWQPGNPHSVQPRCMCLLCVPCGAGLFLQNQTMQELVLNHHVIPGSIVKAAGFGDGSKAVPYTTRANQTIWLLQRK